MVMHTWPELTVTKISLLFKWELSHDLPCFLKESFIIVWEVHITIEVFVNFCNEQTVTTGMF